MQKLKSFIIPIIIVLLSFGVRLNFISKGPFHMDCMGMVLSALHTIETHRLHFLHQHGHPFGAIIGTTFVWFFKVFNIKDPVFAINFMSVLLSSVSIFLYYIFIEKLVNKQTAFFSSILFSLSPIYLINSVYGNTHTPFLVFVLLGLIFLLKYHEKKQNIYMYIGAVFIACAGATRIQDLIAMSIPVALFFLFNPSSKDFKFTQNIKASFKSLTIIILVGFAFYLPVILDRYTDGNIEQLFSLIDRSATRTFIGFHILLFERVLSHLELNFSVLGLIMAFCGFLYLMHKNLKKGLMIFIGFMAPFSIYSCTTLLAPRFFLISFLFLHIAEGFILGILFRGNKLTKTVAILGLFLILGLTLHYIFPVLKFRHENALTPEFAVEVKKNTEKNAIIILNDERPFFDYYAERLPMGRPRNVYKLENSELFEFKKRLDSTLEGNRPVYITFDGMYNYNPDYAFSNFLSKYYRFELITQGIAEDWHQDAELKPQFYRNALYKVEKNRP